MERIDELCCRCGDPCPEDLLVQRLCPGCMKQSGLVRCDYCGRAVHKTITKQVETFNYCPYCVKEMQRKGEM